MNKRPLLAGGLPAKPYVPPSAPAPPLPAGPPPQQAGYNNPPQDQAAAHAAAWAAYYQSQGLTAQGQPQTNAGYNAIQPQQPAGAGASANPYANYGYGGQAAAQHLTGGPPAQHQQPGPQQNYRPPVNAAPQQAYQYPQAGYASPVAVPYQAGPQGFAGQQPGYGAQQQGYQGQGQGGWGQPAPGPGQGAPFRPQQQFHNGGGPPQHFNGPGAGPQQPYTPPHGGGQTPYRPNAAPSPAPMGQNRPYQPQPMGHQQRPPRPPMNQGPTPPHHPPAKRPRFDGPGPGPGLPPGATGPTHLGGPGRPSLPVRPGSGSIPARPPSGPRAPVPTAPITRPPIHLGTGGPPPIFAPGGPRGSTGPMRGMGGDRGRGRGGMVFNAPRGPSHMRREQQQQRDRSRRPEDSPAKKDKDRKDKKRDNKDAKTTMTDFRIVGIELKELGWSWGLVGDQANQEEEAEVEDTKDEVNGKEEIADVAITDESSTVPPPPASNEKVKLEEGADDTDAGNVEVKAGTTTNEKTSASAEEVVKQEPTIAHDEAEGKVGGKRKAQTPDTDEGSAKKRSTYLLTHGKTNDSSAHESNQNRFRIYFESPPEADRVPQALRRNPYKRWRREDSAAPSTAQEGKKGDTSLPEIAESGEGDATQATAASTNENPETVVEHSALDAQALVPEDESGVQVDPTVETAPAAVDPVQTESEIPTGMDTAVDEAAPAESGGSAPVTTHGHDTVETESAAHDVESAEGKALETADSAGPANHEPSTEAPAVQPDSVVDTATPTAEGDAVEIGAVTTDAGEVDETPTASQDPSADTAETGAATGEAATEQVDPVTAAPATQKATDEETGAALAKSAENAASAYKTRTRRRSSVSSTDSRDTVHAFQPEVTPSLNRLSILYEGSQRRMCFDAEVVEKIRVYREEGRIEVMFLPIVPKEEETVTDDVEEASTGLLPKGYLLEEYNQEEQRFAPVFRERLEEIYAVEDASDSVPPLHKHFTPTPSAAGLALNVYLNKKNPLSLPRWCRANTADEWLFEQFGSRSTGWRSKLEIMDPDPPPTLQSILENWSSSSSAGTPHKRTAFTSSLLSEPYDLLEILLRLTRGDRVQPAGMGGGGAGPLATAIRSDSPYASHQTHVSLAILAMYRLTTDYAAKAGEKSEVVTEKIGDIIKSLPSGMIAKSLDGMFREWDGKGGRDRK